MTYHHHDYQPGDRFEWHNEAHEVTGIDRDGLLCFMHNGSECRVEHTKVAWLPQLEVYEAEKKRLRDIGLLKPRYGVDGQQESKAKQSIRQSVTGRRGNFNYLR